MYKPTMPFLSVLAVLALALCSAVALATPVTVTWTNPTTRTDNSALPAGQLLGTRVQRGSCSGTAFGTSQSEVVAAAGATSTVFDLGPGVYCFRAFARATDRDGTAAFLESVASGVVGHTLSDSPPNPPTGLATTSPTVYEPYGLFNSKIRVVGIAPTGTPCYSDFAVINKGQTYYRVAKGDVKIWLRQPKSDARLVAVCA